MDKQIEPSRRLKKLSSRPRSSLQYLQPTKRSMVRPTFGTVVRHSIKTGKLGAVILIVVGIWAVWYLFSSPRFVIRSIEVQGNRSLSKADIVRLAGVDQASIWQVDPQVVAQHVAANTYVLTAPTTILMPDQLIIAVQEREAAILWNVNGINFEVADTGEVLGTSRVTDTDVLVVYDTRTQPITDGQFIDTDALELVQVLNLRVPEELGWSPARYEWDPYYGISVFMQERQIAIGRLADDRMPLDTKLAIIDQLASISDWVFLDVRSTKPYYRGIATPTPEP